MVKLGITFFLKFYCMTLLILTVASALFIGPYAFFVALFAFYFLPGITLLYMFFALTMYKKNLSKFIAYDYTYIFWFSILYTATFILFALTDIIIGVTIGDSELLSKGYNFIMIIQLIIWQILPPTILYLYFRRRKKRGIPEDIFEGMDLD